MDKILLFLVTWFSLCACQCPRILFKKKMYCTITASNYYDAVISCRNFGGKIVEIDNDQKNLFMELLLSHHGWEAAWHGVNFHRGDLLWLYYPSLKNATFVNWDTGYPSHPEQHRCAVVLSNGFWRNRDCLANQRVVCELTETWP